MTIDVKLFGPQARLAQQTSVRMSLAEPATCAALREALAQAVPALAPSLADSRFAVNHEYAGDDQRIGQGDEVALIGMVAGG